MYMYIYTYMHIYIMVYTGKKLLAAIVNKHVCDVM